MPPTTAQREIRHRLIRELLRADRVHSQEQLRKLLRQRGIRAEQATLSRDLHALSVVKGPDGYVMPDAPLTPMSGRAELVHVCGHYLVAADHTGQLLVLRTGPGRAQPLGLALDTARINAMLGTIAGDDTVFVAMRDPASAERLARLLRALAVGDEVEETAFDLDGRTHSVSGGRR